MMVFEEQNMSSVFTVLPAFAVLCAFVWPVSHTLGLPLPQHCRREV